jgi:hypothetical protein
MGTAIWFCFYSSGFLQNRVWPGHEVKKIVSNQPVEAGDYCVTVRKNNHKRPRRDAAANRRFVLQMEELGSDLPACYLEFFFSFFSLRFSLRLLVGSFFLSFFVMRPFVMALLL